MKSLKEHECLKSDLEKRILNKFVGLEIYSGFQVRDLIKHEIKRFRDEQRDIKNNS